MKIVSLILARGGSKGIPKKNIIDLNGRPLISYAIDASFDSGIAETWVSTDCAQIKQVGLDCGALVIDRPAEIATGSSASEESLLHFSALVDFDILVFIQPTSPFIKAKYIKEGLEKIKHCDSVFSVCEEHWIPRWDKNIEPMYWDGVNRPMRQEIGVMYSENGAFYITTREQLLSSKLRYGGKKDIVKMSFLESLQIDSYDDLHLVEQIMKKELCK